MTTRRLVITLLLTATSAAWSDNAADRPAAAVSAPASPISTADSGLGLKEIDALVDSYARQTTQVGLPGTHGNRGHEPPVREGALLLARLRQACGTAAGKERVTRAVHARIERYHHASQVAPPGEIEKAEARRRAASELITLLGLPPKPEWRYFSSPGQAVKKVTQLLKSEDWKTLATYYNLEGSTIDSSLLESGKFFINATRPPMAHPGLPWKYRHPFAPGFAFDRVEATADPEVVRVHLKIAIDEGGGMIQRGQSSFRMRRSTSGYQILPD